MNNQAILKEKAQKKLLSQFSKPMRPDGYDGVMLQRQLGEPMLDLVDRFYREGLLEICDTESGLQHGFNLNQLKSFLRERGLKVSGNKREILSRLLENDFAGMTEQVKAAKLLVLTDKGAKIVDEFHKQEKQELAEHIEQALHALKKRDYGTAYKAYRDYRALNYDDHPIVIGIETDIILSVDDEGEISANVDVDVQPDAEYSEEEFYDASPGQKEQLDIYFSRWPEAYSGIEGQERENIRLMAALMWIWGQELIYDLEKKAGQVFSVEQKRVIQDIFWFGIHECNPNGL